MEFCFIFRNQGIVINIEEKISDIYLLFRKEIKILSVKERFPKLLQDYFI